MLIRFDSKINKQILQYLKKSFKSLIFQPPPTPPLEGGEMQHAVNQFLTYF
jgi:hypothetical protein